MSLIPVASSNLAAIGYSPFGAILTVAFHSGGVYQYSGVPRELYFGLMRAESHGRFFWAFIRNRYPYRRIA